MSLSSSGPRCSWHLSLPLLCSHWLMTSPWQLCQKQGNCSQLAPLCALPGLGTPGPPREDWGTNARLFALCTAACGKTGRSMFSLDGKVDGTFVSNLLNLSACPGVLWPLKCFLEERSAPMWLSCVSPPVANCCWGVLLLESLKLEEVGVTPSRASTGHRCELNLEPYTRGYIASLMKYVFMTTLCVTQDKLVQLPADLVSMQQSVMQMKIRSCQPSTQVPPITIHSLKAESLSDLTPHSPTCRC